MTDEVKKLLKKITDCTIHPACMFCPHDGDCDGGLAIIEKIRRIIDAQTASLEQVKRERDAAVRGEWRTEQ